MFQKTVSVVPVSTAVEAAGHLQWHVISGETGLGVWLFHQDLRRHTTLILYSQTAGKIISSISQPGRKYSSQKSSKGGDDLNLGCSSELCMQRTMSHQNVLVFSVLVVHWGNINLWRKSMWWMYETFSVHNPTVLYARWRKVVEDKLPPYFSPFLKDMFSRSGVVWGCDPVKIGAAAAGCVSLELPLMILHLLIRWQVVKR